MQGTESQPEPALAKEEPETSDFGHQQVKEQMTPSLRLPGPPGGSHGKECLPRRRHGDAGPIPGGADPLEKGKAAHSSLPAQESHGQGSLVGCSPWGRSRVGHALATNTHSLTPPCGAACLGSALLLPAADGTWPRYRGCWQPWIHQSQLSNPRTKLLASATHLWFSEDALSGGAYPGLPGRVLTSAQSRGRRGGVCRL